MVYAQVGIDQRLFTLSDAGYKAIMLLGMYCHQTGLIQAKLDDICTAIHVSRTSAKQAIAELRECGAITIASPASRHEAPVYRVDPALVHKGVRRRSDVSGYVAGLSIPPDKYILGRDLEMVVQTDTVRSGTMLYARMYLKSAKELALREQTQQRKGRREKKGSDEEQLPGQLSFDDLGWEAGDGKDPDR